eukprot:s1603_g18.t1
MHAAAAVSSRDSRLLASAGSRTAGTSLEGLSTHVSGSRILTATDLDVHATCVDAGKRRTISTAQSVFCAVANCQSRHLRMCRASAFFWPMMSTAGRGEAESGASFWLTCLEGTGSRCIAWYDWTSDGPLCSNPMTCLSCWA